MLNIIGINAKEAERTLSVTSEALKNQAILNIKNEILNNIDTIVSANKIDIEAAKSNGLSPTLIDRLILDESRIRNIAEGCQQVANLSDPIGVVKEKFTQQNGMIIEQITVPLGVVAIIYEARPNVTVDSAVLCLKSGNSVILRGGKEAINSNIAFVKIMQQALVSSGLPENSIQLITNTSRASAEELMNLSEYVDVLIPRGGAGLIKAVKEKSRVPIIETGTGNCHAYVDKDADIVMAAEIIFNGKCQRPSVCNSLESVLIHKDIVEKALPIIANKLKEMQTEIRGCKICKKILGDMCVDACEEDYATEFLDYIISIKVVNDIDEAIDHIYKYSTHHSEVIITNNKQSADKFLKYVDSACCYVNSSTRFTDGGEFGFGAEIGISTQKLHARGPMGLKHLTSYKYLIQGNGQTR